MSRTIFIHACNVHQGGGGTLLTALLNELPNQLNIVLSADRRMVLPEKLPENIRVKRVKSSITQRLLVENWLRRNVGSEDIVLCFGNLPPLFKLKGLVFGFVQNRYLIDNESLNGFPIKTQLRLSVERFWLSVWMKNVDEFLVQTPAMKNLLDRRTTHATPVKILPFIENARGCSRTLSCHAETEKEFDFFYVASGEPHKNHRQLINAWCLLAEENIFPSLNLTLDSAQCPELCHWLETRIKDYRLNVNNLGSLKHQQVKQFFQRSTALIYPSTFESFGLPLIEARQAGLAVLASERDYVRDILDPEQVFDPNSAVSIARAVKRYLGIEEPALALQNASGFMKYIVDRME